MNWLSTLVLLLLCTQSLYAKDRPKELEGGDHRQEREAALAKHFGFTYIENDTHLQAMKDAGYLVPIPEDLLIDPKLDPKFRYVTPTTASFLRKLHGDFFAKFNTSFQINSAVRTIVYQNDLKKRNKNAAHTHGPRKSSHPTGGAVDIAKLTLTPSQINWLRERLVTLKKEGSVEAVEEMRQAVFHIMVYRND
jgi:hypothetical protein